MSLSVYINFKQPTRHNYFLSHPYTYDGLSDADKANYDIDEFWEANITHNCGVMASHVPLGDISLYDVCWRPDEVFNEPTTNDLVPLLTAGAKTLAFQSGKLNTELSSAHDAIKF